MSGNTGILQYAEYKDLVDILNTSNVEDSYQKLMGKEDKVLDTVNNTIKYYRDKQVEDGEFVNKSLIEIVMRFINVWIDIWNELVNNGENIDNIIPIFTRKDRIIYVGIMLILLSMLLYMMGITK